MAMRMMQWARAARACRMIIVNKIDAENVDLPALLDTIQDAFGKECLPLNLPAAGGSSRRLLLQPGAGDADFSSVAEAHRALVEQVVEVDAEFMERYLEQGDVDQPEQLHAPLEQALREGHLIPVCFVSAQHRRRRRRAARRDRQAAAEPGRRQSAAVPAAARASARRRCAPSPIRRKHVLAHVFKIASIPTSASSACSACTRARSRRTASSTSAMAASRSRSATCSCCRARTTSR